MQSIPEALAPLAEYKQFVLWKLVRRDDKDTKIPINPFTLRAFPKDSGWQQDPSVWTDANNAIYLAELCGAGYGVGFLFTPSDPFYFVDLDGCLKPDGSGWSDVAMAILAELPGAAVEVSQSGRGLHIFGTGATPEHACKNTALGLELYTEGRFAALTGTNAIGSAATDSSAHLPRLVETYFPPKVASTRAEWTSEPVVEWGGLEDDQELIEKASAAQSAAGAFGGRASFAELWAGDEDALSTAYPDTEGLRAYDGSSADAALAQHLAFWTGKNCERILLLMWQSGLVRDKWQREDYLYRTILNAVSMQKAVYNPTPAPTEDVIGDQFGAPKLRASSDKQRAFAERIRAEKLAACQGEEALILKLCATTGLTASAKFWIDNRDAAPEELAAMATPIEAAADPLGNLEQGPEIVSGYQYLNANLQLDHFRGCVYIQHSHRVFTPGGILLKSEQFNATYGGYVFQLDETGDKTTRKAWEAFTESQVIRYPKAESMCFRPNLPPGALLREEGRIRVNTYVPLETNFRAGDVARFLVHLEKVLPNQHDREILLAYMAAVVQHKGVKFQWAPLLQGTEGNGKTLFTRCVAFAVGQRYTHLPPANEISEKFNEWLFGMLFIGIEDVYVPDHKKEIIEVLKPMITNDRLAMRAMQQSQVMGDNYANFMLNSNHRDAIRKTRNDRRFAFFYTAQQSKADTVRDGMDGNYFPDLYAWLKGEGTYLGQVPGYEAVAAFLETYAIPDELNPATLCHRAPETSSTAEALEAGMGSIEQEILEAVDEGRLGFAGGWISSRALDHLLQEMKMGRAIPPIRRRELLRDLGYDWHPALEKTNGRVNNHIVIDGGKPRLYIRADHPQLALTQPADVARAYEAAQTGAPSGSLSPVTAAEKFGND